MDRKQLEFFLGCLTYAPDFIKDLAKIRRPLQNKLKKGWDWTLNLADSILEKFLKEKCKDLPTVTLPNENNKLVLETDASNNHWSTVLKIKANIHLCRNCSGSFNQAECNYPNMERELLAVTP